MVEVFDNFVSYHVVGSPSNITLYMTFRDQVTLIGNNIHRMQMGDQGLLYMHRYEFLNLCDCN